MIGEGAFMPFETRWLVANRVVYQSFYGDVTVEEFADSVREIRAFIESGVPLVHAIGDLTEVQKYPSLIQMSQVAQRSETLANAGWTVLLVTNPLLRFFGTVLAQFTVDRIGTVATLDEAMQFLSSRDQTIPPFSNSEIEARDGSGSL
jgi:hypothetical protein